MFSQQGAGARAISTFINCSVVLLALLVSAPTAFAVQANPSRFYEYQPDGTRVVLRVRGDERFNWTEDKAGFTVVRSKGWFEFARVNPQGRLVPTGLKVGIDNPRAMGLSPGMLPSPAQRAASAKTSPDPSISVSGSSVAPSGSVRNLVVLIQFSNHMGRALPSASDIDTLMNAPGGDTQLAPTGSVRDVFLQNSYGQLELNSDVSYWITVSGTEQYYANGQSGDATVWEALREALDELDATVDFSQYDSNNDGFIDSIAFIHSGYGAEWGSTDEDGTSYQDRIWSHRWAIQNPVWTSEEGVKVADYHISTGLWGTWGSRIGRIGVIAHETGHFFGLPDLYDTDGGGNGIGSFGLMANSWGFDSSQLCPPHLSPWSKVQLGWIEPVQISQPGQYSLTQSATNNEYLVIRSGYTSGEYLMIENRQNAGFDCSLKEGGLAIWHIDEQAGLNTEGYPGGRWPKDGKHYRVALAQADGLFDLETGRNRGTQYDLYKSAWVDAMAPGPDGHPNTDGYQGGQITYTGHIISDISSPGPVMTFCLNGCSGVSGGGDPQMGFNAPSDLSANVSKTGKGKSASKSVRLSWTDNSNGEFNEDVFIIERCVESGKGQNKSCIYSEHATVGSDVNSFSESPGSDTYRYRVKARRGSVDETAYSNEITI